MKLHRRLQVLRHFLCHFNLLKKKKGKKQPSLRSLEGKKIATETLAMAKLRSSALFSLLISLFLLVSPSIAITDGPFILAHKKVSLERQKSGMERVTVSIDIYNQGSAYVLDQIQGFRLYRVWIQNRLLDRLYFRGNYRSSLIK